MKATKKRLIEAARNLLECCDMGAMEAIELDSFWADVRVLAEDVLGEKVPSAVADSLFDSFWHVYPHKVGKLDAMKAFKQIIAKMGVEVACDIQDRAAEFALDCRRTNREKKFIPHPARWLRSGRFLDEDEMERMEVEAQLEDQL